MKQIKQGYLPFRRHQLYYRIVGAPGDKTPLLVVAGGPGSAHNYLETLDDLARDGRQVVYYDTLSSGRSDQVDGDSLWTVKTYLDELATVRRELNLDAIDLLGHSWGGMLAVEYMLKRPEGIRKLILASTMVSIPLFQQEVNHLKQQLPPETLKIMLDHEKIGLNDAEYGKAYKKYHERHIFNGQGWRDEYQAQSNSAAYTKMWGISEAWADGTLKDFDRSGRLNEISVPTLVIAGEYDEVTPKQLDVLHEGIKNSKLVVIPGGTHCAHIEQPEAFNKAIGEFLSH